MSISPILSIPPTGFNYYIIRAKGLKPQLHTYISYYKWRNIFANTKKRLTL